MVALLQLLKLFLRVLPRVPSLLSLLLPALLILKPGTRFARPLIFKPLLLWPRLLAVPLLLASSFSITLLGRLLSRASCQVLLRKQVILGLI